MKKSYLFLLLMCITLVLVQCKKKENNPSQSEKVQDFFTVTNAKLYKESLPQSSSGSNLPVIEEVTGNSSIIDGGNNILKLHSSNSDIKDIIISKKGAYGYYKLDVTSVKANEYQILLVFNSSIPEDEFTIILAIVNDQNLISAYHEIMVRRIENVGAGILQFSMSFDLLNDIDLHVEQPDGSEIYYGNPGGFNYYALYAAAQGQLTTEQFNEFANIENEVDQIAYLSEIMDIEPYKVKGGWLDIDSNAGCGIDSVNNENINYPFTSDILAGEYIVRVDFWSDCVGGELPTNYVVTAKYNGEIIATTSGENPYQGLFEPGTSDGGGQGSGVEVMRINIDEALLKANENTKPTYEFIYNKEQIEVQKGHKKVNITKPTFRLNQWIKKVKK